MPGGWGLVFFWLLCCSMSLQPSDGPRFDVARQLQVQPGRLYFPIAISRHALIDSTGGSTVEPSQTRMAPTPTPRVGVINPEEPPLPTPFDDVYGGCEVETIQRGTDGVVISAQHATYNDDSMITQLVNDFDGDGIVDRTESYDYGPLGLIASREIDDDGDGSIDSVIRYIYSDGMLMRLTVSRSGQGVTQEREYSYDNGLLESEIVYLIASGVRSRSSSRFYQYDDLGRRIRVSFSNRRCARYVRDEYRIIRVESFSCGAIDGPVEDSYEYEYDGANRLTRSVRTGPGNNMEEYTYNDHGWLVQHERYRGHLESDVRFQYNSRGHLVSIEGFDVIRGWARSERLVKCDSS